MEPNEAAKTEFICYRQLEEIVRFTDSAAGGNLPSWVGQTTVPHFNQVVHQLKRCFQIDSTFLSSIEGIKPIGEIKDE